jgi:hypothetical protein
MKSPFTQRPDSEAREATEEFIARYHRQPATRPSGAKAPDQATTSA